MIFLWAGLLGASAQPKTDPNWPCVQRKVPTISAGAVWTGPDLAAAGQWDKDFEAAALAQKLASRRTPIDDTDALISDFAGKAGAEKAMRLTRVFAGVLDIINTDRDRIVEGIERYARGQARLAEKLREESDTVSAVKDEPGAELKPETKAVESQFAWDKRIFDERRQALTYVCESPVILEQRVFEIARRIEGQLS